jgi:RNA polymerase sigma-70 factor, ECF subfamily
MAADLDPVLAAAGAGDEQAMRVVWRAHQPMLLRFLRARIGADDADDIAQQVWVEVARLLVSFEGDAGEFRRMLFGVARRRLIDEFRRRGRRPEFPGDEVPEQATSVDFDASDSLERAINLVRRLPQDQSEAVLLRIIGDLDVAQVAEIMGKSEGSVRVLVHRGLHRLAEMLSPGAKPVTNDESATMKEVR